MSRFDRKTGHDEPDWSSIPDPAGALAGDRTHRSSGHAERVMPVMPRARSRAAVQRRRYLGGALAAAWLLVVGTRFSVRHDIAVSATFVAAQCGLWMVAIAAALAATLTVGRSGLGASSTRIAWTTVAAPTAFVLLALVWTAPGGEPWAVGEPRLLLPCMISSLLIALPALAAASWGLAHTWVSRAAPRGAALGVAAGLIGAVVLFFHCGMADGGHVAFAHGVPVMIAAALGSFIGQRFLRI